MIGSGSYNDWSAILRTHTRTSARTHAHTTHTYSLSLSLSLSRSLSLNYLRALFASKNETKIIALAKYITEAIKVRRNKVENI